MDTPSTKTSTTQTIAEIRQWLGDRLSTAPAVREQHGKDQTWNPGAPPDAVAFVRSTEEVQRIVATCAKHATPIIPYGTGTSLEGHFSAPFGGISIDLSQMNRILEVNAADLDCRVEAGVTRKQLNAHLRDQGLFFPVDPGADASLGGMTATTGIRHQRRALWHHAGECPQRHRRHGQWRDHPHGKPGAEVLRGL